MGRMNTKHLTEAQLVRSAGDVVFGRGEDYVRHVRGLVVMGSCATAVVQAKSAYAVELDWAHRDLAGDCTCPHFERGYFCKHLVAVGLAAISGCAPLSLVPPSEPDDVLVSYLQTLEVAELRDLVAELAARDEGVDQFVRIRAAISGANGADASKTMVESVTAALNVRGFIDYRRSFEVARAASDILDDLEGQFEFGAAEIIRPALLKALTRLRTLTLNADDSSGSIGDACQRAADLYARACREGAPDAVKLARWLAKFRDESPGWPVTVLGDFVDALDEKGLRAYRKAVDGLDQKYAGVDHWKRFDIDRMLLELADLDGDVDRAIDILQSGEHPDFRGIVDRLGAAGRDADVIAWTDRAVADGRVSGSHGKGPYWLDPAEVADRYLAIGREDDAMGVLRNNFQRTPGLETFQLLLRFAERLGIGGSEREWALSAARQLAVQHSFSNGAVLVEIALADQDLEAAWAVADEFGPGHQWRQLSAASAKSDPRRAADLYRPEVRGQLVHTNSKNYPGIAKTLSVMKGLYERAGDGADFAELMVSIREEYGRRPSLMKALDKRGL